MNIYLIASDSYKKIDREVKEIIKDSINVYKFNLSKDSLDDVLNEINYVSLIDEKKYVLVKADNLFKVSKKDETSEKDSPDSSKLEKYLENPNPNVCLIITSYEMPDKRKKLYKEFDKKGKVILLPALNKKDLCYECMNILKKAGYNANYETANFIVENSYVNYDIMDNELNKIFTLIKKGNLEIKDIESIISTSVNGSAYDYINAVLKKDLKKAFASTKNFDALKIEPSVVMIMLAKEFIILNSIKSGVEPYKVQMIYKKEDWQMRSYMNSASDFSKKEVQKNIIKLNDYDYRLKSGKVDKSIILDLIAMDLCS